MLRGVSKSVEFPVVDRAIQFNGVVLLVDPSQSSHLSDLALRLGFCVNRDLIFVSLPHFYHGPRPPSSRRPRRKSISTISSRSATHSGLVHLSTCCVSSDLEVSEQGHSRQQLRLEIGGGPSQGRGRVSLRRRMREAGLGSGLQHHEGRLGDAGGSWAPPHIERLPSVGH